MAPADMPVHDPLAALRGRRVVLGVSGGIAAYKAVDGDLGDRGVGGHLPEAEVADDGSRTRFAFASSTRGTVKLMSVVPPVAPLLDGGRR